MYFVYILYSQKHNRFYTGFTNDTDRRLSEHNLGNVKTTKNYKPWIIVYTEQCLNRKEARKCEKYWKSGIGRERRMKFIS